MFTQDAHNVSRRRAAQDLHPRLGLEDAERVSVAMFAPARYHRLACSPIWNVLAAADLGEPALMMLGCLLAQRWLNWVPAVLANTEDYVHSYCRSWLLVLSSLIASVEDALTWLFEWESRILAVPPCGVYMARESAIVIMGGDDGES